MGFFNRMLYTKEGKGIEKDDPEKRAFFKFWEIAWNKRFKLVLLNLMYLVPNLIAVALAACSYIVAVAFYFTITKGVSVWEAIESSADSAGATWLFFFGMILVTVLFTVVPIFAAGPFCAGMTFITRSFVKREPVFLWHDYITKTKSNLKLSLKVSLLNAFIGFVLMNVVAFYMSCSAVDSNLGQLLPDWMLYVAAAVVVFSFFLFLAMNLYIYPMITTFNITMKQLYKNAAIFAFIKWLPNLGILFLLCALIVLPLLFINGIYAYIFSLLIYALIGPAFSSYLQLFYVYPTLKKYMIDNPNADRSQKTNGG